MEKQRTRGGQQSELVGRETCIASLEMCTIWTHTRAEWQGGRAQQRQVCRGHPSSQQPAQASWASAGRAQHHGRSTAGRRDVALQMCRQRAKGRPAGAWLRLAKQSQHCFCKHQPADARHSPCSQHDGHGAALHRPKHRGVPQMPAPLGLCCWYHQRRKALEASSWPQAAQHGSRAMEEMPGLIRELSGMAEPSTPAQAVSVQLWRESPDATSKVLFYF